MGYVPSEEEFTRLTQVLRADPEARYSRGGIVSVTRLVGPDGVRRVNLCGPWRQTQHHAAKILQKNPKLCVWMVDVKARFMDREDTVWYTLREA